MSLLFELILKPVAIIFISTTTPNIINTIIITVNILDCYLILLLLLFIFLLLALQAPLLLFFPLPLH